MKKTNTKHYLFYFSLLIVVTLCGFSLSGCDDSESQPTLLISGSSQEPKFVSVGSDGLHVRASLSSDGTTWTQVYINGGGLYRVAYGNGKLVAASQYSSVSEDGIFWKSSSTQITTFGGISALAYGNGIFVAAAMNVTGASRTWISRDGITWTNGNVSFGTIMSNPMGIAYGNGVFVLVGSSEFRMRSTDGINWTNEDREASGVLRGVAYGNGLFIAVGDSGACYISSDKGITWTPGASLYNGEDGYGIAYGDGVFIVVGTSGLRSVTTDGLSWSNSVASGDDLRDIAYGNGIFVSVGLNGRCIRSVDNGVTWTNNSTEADAWSDSITYMK